MYKEYYYDLHPTTDSAFEIYPKNVEKTDNELLNITKTQTVDMNQEDFFIWLNKLIDSKTAVKLLDFSNGSLLLEYIDSNDLKEYFGQEKQENEIIEAYTQNIMFSPSVLDQNDFRSQMAKAMNKYTLYTRETNENIKKILERKAKQQQQVEDARDAIYFYCKNNKLLKFNPDTEKDIYKYLDTENAFDDALEINKNYAPDTLQKALTATTFASTIATFVAPLALYGLNGDVKKSFATLFTLGAITFGQKIYSEVYSKKRANKVISEMHEEIQNEYNFESKRTH